MAETSTTDKKEWAPFLERFSGDHEGDLVTIELLDPTYGDLEEVQRLPFAYAAFDPRDDVVIVAVGGKKPHYPVVLRHMIWKPSELDATDRAMRVLDADGTATLVNFFPDETAA